MEKAIFSVEFTRDSLEVIEREWKLMKSIGIVDINKKNEI